MRGKKAGGLQNKIVVTCAGQAPSFGSDHRERQILGWFGDDAITDIRKGDEAVD